MKMATARTSFKKSTLFVTAFVLVISTFTAAVPFLLSKNAAAASTIPTTNLSTWDLSETRTAGHNQLVAGGLHVWTEPSTGSYANEFSKAAGYYSTPGLKLSDINSTAINFASYSGVRPSVQIGVDRDGNGTWDGYLVYEPWSYGDGQYWTNKTGFGVAGGGGYASMGTLAQYQQANPNAKVTSIGYSLGSGVVGDAVISSIVIGETTYTFDLPPVTLSTPTNLIMRDGAQGYTVIPAGLFSNSHNPVNAQLSWDPVTNATGYTVEVYKDGVLVGGSGFGWNGSWVGFDGNNFGKAGDGAYTFVACATNPAAVVAKVCSAPTAAYVYDTTAPTGTLSYSPSTTTNQAVTVTLTTNEPIKQSSLPGTWLMKSPTKFQKVYPSNTTQVVTLEDLNGNTSTVTVSINWIDKVAPTVTLKSAPDTLGSNGIYQKVSYKLYDLNQIDKAEVNGHVIDLSNNQWSDLNNISVGSMFGVLGANTVKVYDVAGNVTTVSFTLDNVAPVAQFVFPPVGPSATSFTVQYSEAVNPAEATNPANYFLNNWVGAGGSGDLQGDATIVYDPITFKATITFTSPFWYVSPEQQWGVQNIHDLAGNVLSTNPTTAYSTPNVAPTNPGTPTTASPSNNATSTWMWTAASDPNGSNGSGLKGYEYAFVQSGQTPSSWTFTTDTTATTTAPADGTYTLYVRALDNAGNQSGTVSGNVTVDTTAPDVQFNTLSTAATATPTITGTINDPDAELALEVDGGTPITLTNNGSTWSYDFTTPLSAGVHHLVIGAKDVAGNTSFSTADLTVALPTNTVEVAATGEGTPPAQTTLLTTTPTIVNPAAFAAVLGTSTTDPSTSNSDVKGDSTKNTVADAVHSEANQGTFLGMAWYWWLLIIAAIVSLIWWISAAIRNRQAQL